MNSNFFKTCSNVFKWFQMCSNLFKTCSNVFKLVQMCSNVLKLVQNLFKRIQMCSNLFKTRLGICQKIYTTQFTGKRILHTKNAQIQTIFASNKQQKCIIISNLALFWLKLNKMCKFFNLYEESLHLGVCKLAKYVRTALFSGKIYTSDKKIYTTAGRDGRDKFQVCSKLVQMCSNVFKLVQNLFKRIQMCSNLFKTCSNVFKLVQSSLKCV